MKRTLLATGNLTWNSAERRTDRYGSVRLTDAAAGDTDVFLAPEMDELEGRQGRLVAEVLEPVDSPHMGDLFRGLSPTTPDLGERVVFGEGELFIEHYGRAIHEQSEMERQDAALLQAVAQDIAAQGAKIRPQPAMPPEIYDLIGLKPADGREADWMNPEAFYRTHLSKVALYFEED